MPRWQGSTITGNNISPCNDIRPWKKYATLGNIMCMLYVEKQDVRARFFVSFVCNGSNYDPLQLRMWNVL
jgi:hypothetical protein